MCQCTVKDSSCSLVVNIHVLGCEVVSFTKFMQRKILKLSFIMQSFNFHLIYTCHLGVFLLTSMQLTLICIFY